MKDGPRANGHGWVAGWLDEITLLMAALAAGVGAGRLTSGPLHSAVFVPIALCVVVGHLTTSLVGRRPRIWVLSPLAGILAVALTAVWTFIPGATRDGIPTSTTWRFVVSRFDDAGTIIRGHPTPLPPLSSVVMVLAVAAGLTAVLGRALWGLEDGRQPFAALAPTFGLVCYTALFSSRLDRVQGALTYIATALLFLVITGRAPVAAHRRPRRGLASGFVGGSLAVGVALACSTGLAGMQLEAFPNPVGNGTGGTGAVLHAAIPDLVDNIQAVLSNESKDVMFTASSSLPTYWQVGTLSQFDGTQWDPDPLTQAAADGIFNGYGTGAVPVLAAPTPMTTFVSQVTIVDLQGTLLPVPPTTIGVTDAAISDFLPAVGLVQPIAASAGSTYSTVATVPTVSSSGIASSSVSAAASDSSSAAVPAASLDYYLTLPPVPAKVVKLAHHIVAGITGPLNQAAALARYFDTGRFQYTLYPTVQPGENPLVSFLFTTRAGFCQQFAGAYAVLARLDGLPTRVAIGFTPGSTRNGVYTVTGADAHAWPEVYLGPSTGWVSFEPTPAQSHESLATGVVIGSRVKAPQRSKSSTHTKHAQPNISLNPVIVPTVATTLPSGASHKGPKPRNINKPAPTGSTANRSSSSSSSRGAGLVGRITLMVLGALAVLAVVDALLGGHARRRLRERTRKLWHKMARRLRILSARLRPQPGRFTAVHNGPTTDVISRWEHAARLLDASRLPRRSDETLTEHALRIGHGGTSNTTLPWTTPGLDAPPLRQDAFDAYRQLADLATKASYGADPCTPQDAGRAKKLCDAVRAGLE